MTGPSSAPRANHRLPYLPALDGLRAVAVAMVMAYHARLPVAGRGDLGVDVFFGLSGFLITTLVLAEYRSTKKFSLRHFWARRFVRLFPAYALVAIVCVAVAALGNFPGTLRGAVLSGLYLANWGAAAGLGLGLLRHTWSLSIEEQFYLFWPTVLIVLWTWWRGRRALLALAIAGAATASIILALVLLAGPVPEEWVANATPSRSGPLLAGAALAVLLGPMFVSGPVLVGRPATARIIDLAGGMGLGLLLGAAALGTSEPALIVAVLWPAVTIGTLVCVSACVLVPKGRLAWLLGRPLLTAIGRISYGIYLWHFPLFMMVDVRFGGLPVVPLTVAAVLSIVVAAASHRWLEQPLLRAHRRHSAITAGTTSSAGVR